MEENSKKMKSGLEKAPHRSLLYALGLTREEMERPLVGVVNAASEVVPGHLHLGKLAEAVKAGVRMAGGTPLEFPAIAVCDGIAMNHEGMRFSLPSREFIADSIEIMARAHAFDALVFIPNCDKCVPGMLMAMMRLNIPSVPPVRRPLPERLGRVLRCAVCACAQCFFIRKKPEAVNTCPRQAAGPQGTPRPIPGLWHAAKWARFPRMENRTTPPSTPSLARRYICKLLANVASVPVYLAMEAILPRALGPAMYGNYSFATNFFQQLFMFLDMGTSTCFYNALSRRQSETGLISFYMRLSLLIAVISLLIAGAMQVPLVGNWLMPDVPLWLAPLAAIWAFLTWWGRVLRSMNDAVGATVQSEMVRTVVSLSAVFLLIGLFLLDWLNIFSLFGQQYAMLGVTALGYWIVTRRHWERCYGGPDATFCLRLSADSNKAYRHEFFTYSHPLFVQALLIFLMAAAERWLLQWFDGSAEQGYFALGHKVCLACLMFVSAMTPLVMRELSIAWGQRDLQLMGRLVNRFAPLIYAVAAYFACFSMAEGPALVRIFGGAEFTAAILPVQVMALSPLHQSYLQLASSVFHASGRTRELRNLTLLECVYGMTTAWFLLAPEAYGGLHLGAVGLSIKTIAVQCVTVNICLWRASRFVPIRLLPIMLHEIWCVLVLAAVPRQDRFYKYYTQTASVFPAGPPWPLPAASSPSCWAWAASIPCCVS